MPAGASTKEFVARKAALTIGNQSQAAGKNWIFRWGYSTHEEAVNGSAIPRVLHGVFHGEVECDTIYCSDDTFMALAANLDTVYTVLSTDTDVASSPTSKAWTASIKIRQVERAGPPNGDGVIRARLSGTMTAYPT